MKKTEKKVVSVYLPSKIVEKAKRKANKEGRSFSNWLTQLLQREAA